MLPNGGSEGTSSSTHVSSAGTKGYGRDGERESKKIRAKRQRERETERGRKKEKEQHAPFVVLRSFHREDKSASLGLERL